jgi:cell division protein FtsL
MNKKNKGNSKAQAPLLRVRHLVGIAVAITLMVAVPLGIVWKQVYITQTSVRHDRLSDSLAILGKQMAQLRLNVEKLSSTSRIESIAREGLGLDYPTANQIVIIKQRQNKPQSSAAEGNYIAILRRSITRERG